MNLYPLLIAFIIGTLAGLSGRCPFWPSVLLTVLSFAALIPVFGRRRSALKTLRLGAVRTGALCLAALSFGMLTSMCHPSAPSVSKERFEELKNAASPNTPVGIRAEKRYTGEHGDRILGRVLYPEKWKNHKLWISIPVSDVYEGDLIEIPVKAIRGNGRVTKGDVKLMEAGADAGHDRNLSDRRRKFISRIGLQPRTQGLVNALLFADSKMVDASLRGLMADTGLSHLLALSGMHIGIIAAIAMFLLYPVRLWGFRKLHLFLALAAVWMFVLFVAGSPSTVRAAIMLTAAGIAMSLGRPYGAANGLAIAAFIIILVSPDSLFDIGFQFSFLAVAAMIGFGNRLNPIEQSRHPRLYKIVGAIIVTIAVSVATWVLTAWYFGRVPLSFLPFNLVAVPLLALYMIVAALYVGYAACFGVSPGIERVGRILDYFPQKFCELATDFGDGTVIEFNPDLWMVWGWLALLAFGALFLYKREVPD